jgi:hypothetical protein
MSEYTYIAPDRCPIDGVPFPHDGADKVNEATKCSPNHVHARPHVPQLQMPPQGNERCDATDPREYCERDIDGGHLIVVCPLKLFREGMQIQ